MTAKLRKKAMISGSSRSISAPMRALLAAGAPMVTTSSVMAMANSPSLRLTTRLNSRSFVPRSYRRRLPGTAAILAAAGLLALCRWWAAPAGVAHSAGLEEQAVLGAGERHLLVGVDAAALDDLAARQRAGRVVAAVCANGHRLSFSRRAAAYRPHRVT